MNGVLVTDLLDLSKVGPYDESNGYVHVAYDYSLHAVEAGTVAGLSGRNRAYLGRVALDPSSEGRTAARLAS